MKQVFLHLRCPHAGTREKYHMDDHHGNDVHNKFHEVTSTSYKVTRGQNEYNTMQDPIKVSLGARGF
jgi:hypothetical protein